MVLEIKRPMKDSNRGFVVRMRLTNRGKQEKKDSFFRYYLWILVFFLSLYLLTSYFVVERPISMSKIHLLSNHKPLSLASRALIESTDTDGLALSNTEVNVKTGLFDSMKIYVYDLPSKYNTDWLSDDRCATHLFASEVAIHQALLSSSAGYVRTLNPYEADFFFVPVYVSCNFSAINGFPSLGHARSLLSSAVDYVSDHHPFWNRSRGSDHVFVASHDYGACFHAMEDQAIEEGIPNFMRNSIILQTFGVKHKHPCQDVENVVIPPYISPESVRKNLKRAAAGGNGRRDIWVFFRGKMEVNPKNISGRFYSKGVRTVILKKYGGDRRRFYLKRHRFSGYQSEIIRSTFCLCPLGWAPWSPRLVESVLLGCVPVIIADGIRLPFPGAVRWPEISLTVAEKDAGKLKKILGRVSATNLSVIQRKLRDPSVKRALLYNVPMQEGDATWQILEALSRKLQRSYWRSVFRANRENQQVEPRTETRGGF